MGAWCLLCPFQPPLASVSSCCANEFNYLATSQGVTRTRQGPAGRESHRQWRKRHLVVDLSHLQKSWGKPHPAGQGQPGLNVVLPLPTCLDFSAQPTA